MSEMVKCPVCGVPFESWRGCQVCENAEKARQAQAEAQRAAESAERTREEARRDSAERAETSRRENEAREAAFQERLAEDQLESEERIREALEEETAKQRRIQSDGWKLQAESEAKEALKCWQRGDIDDAARLAKRAIDRNPNNLTGHGVLALCCFREKMPIEGSRHWKMAARLFNPDTTPAWKFDLLWGASEAIPPADLGELCSNAAKLSAAELTNERFANVLSGLLNAGLDREARSLAGRMSRPVEIARAFMDTPQRAHIAAIQGRRLTESPGSWLAGLCILVECHCKFGIGEVGPAAAAVGSRVDHAATILREYGANIEELRKSLSKDAFVLVHSTLEDCAQRWMGELEEYWNSVANGLCQKGGGEYEGAFLKFGFIALFFWLVFAISVENAHVLAKIFAAIFGVVGLAIVTVFVLCPLSLMLGKITAAYVNNAARHAKLSELRSCMDDLLKAAQIKNVSLPSQPADTFVFELVVKVVLVAALIAGGLYFAKDFVATGRARKEQVQRDLPKLQPPSKPTKRSGSQTTAKKAARKPPSRATIIGRWLWNDGTVSTYQDNGWVYATNWSGKWSIQGNSLAIAVYGPFGTGNPTRQTFEIKEHTHKIIRLRQLGTDTDFVGTRQ